MKPDPLLVISVSLFLIGVVGYILLNKFLNKPKLIVKYKRLLKYYSFEWKHMSDAERMYLAIIVGFAILYGILLYKKIYG